MLEPCPDHNSSHIHLTIRHIQGRQTKTKGMFPLLTNVLPVLTATGNWQTQKSRKKTLIVETLNDHFWSMTFLVLKLPPNSLPKLNLVTLLISVMHFQFRQLYTDDAPMYKLTVSEGLYGLKPNEL